VNAASGFSELEIGLSLFLAHGGEAVIGRGFTTLCARCERLRQGQSGRGEWR